MIYTLILKINLRVIIIMNLLQFLDFYLILLYDNILNNKIFLFLIQMNINVILKIIISSYYHKNNFLILNFFSYFQLN